MGTVSLSVYRFDRIVDRAWVFTQMQFARGPLSRVPGIGFHKLLGSGTGEGFTPVPNPGVWAILATWPSESAARAAIATMPPFAAWRERASEAYTVHLQAIASRGVWDGRAPFDVAEGEGVPSPIAVLTRATVKPSRALAFWRQAPGVSRLVHDNADQMLFKIGLGEVPWLQQVTFSIWRDAGIMARFAYRDGAHKAAIEAVRAGGFFREELYARFRVIGEDGGWNGVKPVADARPLSPDASREAAR